MQNTARSWQEVASAKKSSLLASIPAAWRFSELDVPPATRLKDVTTFITQFLTPLEQQITNATVPSILENIQSFNWSAIEVTRAFCHRAALAHQLSHCLSEIFFEEAYQRAEELDTILHSTGKIAGPLHGLPISLKDRFHIKGFDSACGYVSWIGESRSEDDEGFLVQKLRQAGAILYVKTNVPMSMLIGETTNNIVGSTINPFNRNLSAGGASGGEAALLALKGSPIGWGTDIAGSIRIPCAFNNLYGIRPSFGRISASGLADNLPGLPTAASVIGPMSADLVSLIQLMRWFISSNAWQSDYKVIDMPWKEAVFMSTRNRICQPAQRDGSLVFAVMKSDEEVCPHPPVQRAIEMVTAALLQRGYEVIEWKPPPHRLATDVLFQILGSTAGQSVRSAVEASGEPPIPQLTDLFSNNGDSLPTSEFWRLCAMRERYQSQYHEYWASTRRLTACKRVVDGVILPVAPHAAPPEGSFKYYAYSAVPSVLDYTTGTIPVTFADRFIDHEIFQYTPMNNDDRVNWRLYDKDRFDGSPVGVQIMGQRFQEEKVLAMMGAVQDALQQFTPV